MKQVAMCIVMRRVALTFETIVVVVVAVVVLVFMCSFVQFTHGAPYREHVTDAQVDSSAGIKEMEQHSISIGNSIDKIKNTTDKIQTNSDNSPGQIISSNSTPEAIHNSKSSHTTNEAGHQTMRHAHHVTDVPVTSTESSMKFVTFETGDTIRLKCHIPTGPYLVMWNKIGIDYPLSIGTKRFVPDTRIQTRFKPPDKWRLTITNAKLSDSGVYTCTTSANKPDRVVADRSSVNQAISFRQNHSPNKLDTKINGLLSSNKPRDTGGRKDNVRHRDLSNVDYYVTVVEPNPNEKYQVDVPATERTLKPNKSIVVTGPKIVFYGTPLELICRASFTSTEAKLNPTISLEWYHRGVRQKPSATRSGGVYISERWLDSNLLESRLLIAWASEADAGQWICLDRSNWHSVARIPELHRPSNYTRLKFAQSSNPNKPVRTVHNVQGDRSLSATNPRQMFLATSLLRSYVQDVMFDRIDVEIVDLPDPTAETPLDSASNSLPTFVESKKPNDRRYNYRPTSSLYGKRETAGELRYAAASRQPSFIPFKQSNHSYSIHPSYRLLISLLILSRVIACQSV